MTAANNAEMIQASRDMIVLYLKAEKAVLMNQSYTIGGQSLTRADLEKIRAGRKEWEEKLTAYLGNGGRVIRRITYLED